jgi:hypothetical protein
MPSLPAAPRAALRPAGRLRPPLARGAASARRACRPIAPRRGERGHRLGLSNRIGERVAASAPRPRAPAAMLDDHRAGVARLVDRREADEQAVVAHPPGEAFVGAHAAGALAMVIRRTWAVPVLPAILTPVERQLGAGRGAVAVDHARHRRRTKARCSTGSTGRGGAAGLSRGEPRLDQPAARDPRRHHRQLERIDQHVALADRHVDRVVGLPFAMVFALHPFRIGHGAVALGRPAGRTSGRSPAACAIGAMTSIPTRRPMCRNRCRSCATIAACMVDRAVPAVAVEDVVADPVAAGAVDPLARDRSRPGAAPAPSSA